MKERFFIVNNGKNYEKYSQNVASEEVLRKIKSEYRKGNTGSNLIELDWLGRLYEIGNVLRMTVKGKCIDGYLREVMSYNEFTMYLN